MKYWIHPIPLCCGPRDCSEWTYMYNRGRPSATCYYIWLLEGAGSHILVDAGCYADFPRAQGLEMTDIQTVEQGLARYNLRPEEIQTVILTHLHTDHIQQARLFKNARFIVQKDEMEFARRPHPFPARLGTFRPELLDNLDIELISGDRQIADGIRVVPTPGHTAGNQSVIISTPGGMAVITGFCCTLDNFRPPARLKASGINVIAPTRHFDMLKAWDSTELVFNSGYFIIPLHENSFMQHERLPW